MQEYTCTDFKNTLDEAGRRVFEAVHCHMADNYPEYKPFNIKPLNKSNNISSKWQVNFRKKPEFGKAFCSLYSVDGKLSVRVIGSGFMIYELFLRQNEFGDKIRNYIFYNGFCENCGRKCYNQYREYWYINGEMLTSGCKKNEKSAECIGVIDDYPAINNVTENDIKDLLYLLDIQGRHISRPKNPREIRGAAYAETCKKRCGDVAVIELEDTELDIDDFDISDYCNTKRLDKYINEYSLTLMGAYDGLWFYHNPKAVCGEAESGCRYNMIPKGHYAFVTIYNPFSFSAWSVWTYIASYMRDNNINIRLLDFDGTSIPYLIKLNRSGSVESMAVYIPVE